MGKQLLMLGVLGLTSIIALVSCQLASPPKIPPEQLLMRAVYANSTLESVFLKGGAQFSLPGSFSGSVTGTGALRRGGESSAFDLNLTLSRSTRKGFERLGSRMLLRSPGAGKTYITLTELSGLLADPLHAWLGDDFQGKLWMLPSSHVGTTSNTPDPSELRAILSQLSPAGDAEILSLGRGKYQYHLQVEAVPNAEGMLASGELWIDAGTFLLDKLVWRLTALKTTVGHANVTLTLEFADQGRAIVPTVTETSEAPEFPLQPILHTIF